MKFSNHNKSKTIFINFIINLKLFLGIDDDFHQKSIAKTEVVAIIALFVVGYI